MPAVGAGRPNPHEAIRLRERERADQDAVHHREHSRVCADPQRENEQRNQGEPGVAEQGTQRVVHVLPEPVHLSSSRSLRPHVNRLVAIASRRAATPRARPAKDHRRTPTGPDGGEGHPPVPAPGPVHPVALHGVPAELLVQVTDDELGLRAGKQDPQE